MNSFNHYRLPLNSLVTWIPAGYMLIVDVLVIQPCPRTFSTYSPSPTKPQ